MKRLITSLTILSLTLASAAQPAQFIRHREASSITFAVDEVDLPENLLGFRTTGDKLAPTLSPQLSSDSSDWFSDWEPEILFNSFASEELFDIGEDVIFQMLLKAWCQHRPVSLSPDDWFWKDIVKKSRPRTIQGPACGRQRKPLSRFDGWFVRTVNQHDSKQ